MVFASSVVHRCAVTLLGSLLPLAAALAMTLGSAACQAPSQREAQRSDAQRQSERPRSMMAQRLVSAPDQLERARFGGESRSVLAGGEQSLPLRVPADATLRLGFAVRKSTAPAASVIVTATLESGDETATLLRRTVGGPLNLSVDRWHDVEISLGGVAQQDGVLHLSAHNEDGTASRSDAVVWTNPVLLSPGSNTRTNVLLISIDTLRADRLGCYGSARDTSPNIDRMAREGVLFRRALSSSTWTLPSHASMLTGLDPQHHGAVRYGNETPLRAELDTLAEQLSRAGFATAGFVGSGFVDAALGFDQGFDRYFTLGHETVDSFETSAAEAVGWMDRQLHVPFFVFLHTYQVHMPYDPPPPYDRMFDPEYDGPLRGNIRNLDRGRLLQDPRLLAHARALYDGLIRYTDTIIGELRDYLTVSGLARNTCVIITSDHGEEFAEHGGVLHGNVKLYEELLHVPLIVWCPSRFTGGATVAGVVSSVDITPTVLDIAGVPLPHDIQGRSLLGSLSGGSAASGRVVLSTTDGSVEVGRGAAVSLSDDRYRVIGSTEGGSQPRQIYDLTVDPHEQTNLYGTRPDLVETLAPPLDQALEDLRSSPAIPTPQPVDPALLERLRALGYAH